MRSIWHVGGQSKAAGKAPLSGSNPLELIPEPSPFGIEPREPFGKSLPLLSNLVHRSHLLYPLHRSTPSSAGRRVEFMVGGKAASAIFERQHRIKSSVLAFPFTNMSGD